MLYLHCEHSNLKNTPQAPEIGPNCHGILEHVYSGILSL